MKITDMPSRVSDLRIPNRSFASPGVSTAVGSSRMRMSALPVERLQDLDALLLADGDVLDACVGIDREVEALRQVADAAVRGAVVEEDPGRIGLGAEHDVLGDRHHRDEHEVLVDHPDPVLDRILRGVHRDRLALDEDLALVGLVDAVDDVHERRLAGAVLTEERVHLAAAKIEVDSIVRDDPRKALRDAAQFQDGRGGDHRARFYGVK